MRSARGVDPITSLAFVLNLDNNAHRLRRSRDAGARTGLRSPSGLPAPGPILDEKCYLCAWHKVLPMSR